MILRQTETLKSLKLILFYNSEGTENFFLASHAQVISS